MKLQMLKKTMIAYVAYVANSAEAIWSAVAYPLKIKSTKGRNSKDYKIYGNKSYRLGELTTKNLFDCEDLSEITVGDLKSDGNMGTNTNYHTTGYIPVSGKGFTLSGIQIGSTICMCAYDFDKNFLCSVPYAGKSSITISSETEISYIRFSYSVSANIVQDLTKIQLEEGDIATEYEPYQKYKIPVTARGKNLLDVNKLYPKYANDEGGITYTNLDFPTISSIPIEYNYKITTQYTFSLDYSLTDSDNNAIGIAVVYTDGTKTIDWIERNLSGNKVGSKRMFSDFTKTVKYFAITYITRTRTINVKLANIQIEEGGRIPEYEPYIEPQTVNIYLNEPLVAGGVIQKSVDGLPPLPQFNGTTIYEVMTGVPPSGIQVCYYE